VKGESRSQQRRSTVRAEWALRSTTGARIVSHHFAMGDVWLPDAEQDVSGLMIYLWNIRP
jgi:hypothetical protein